MILLVDIGNTRIKWASLDERGLGAQAAQSHTDWGRDALLHTMLRTVPRPDRVVVANVGGSKIGTLLHETIRSEWQIEAQFVRSTAAAGGVRNAYREPEKLGVDRWAAMIGARALQDRTICVVSTGTAMTIDAVDASGLHLGGVIVPGPQLMVASLLRNTSDIAQRAEGGSVAPTLFADNTLGAIHQGAAHALAALVERAVDQLSRKTGETPTLYLTGGASFLIEPQIAMPFTAVPDLVLQGLAVLARTMQA